MAGTSARSSATRAGGSFALRLEAFALRLEAFALRLEAFALRLEAFAIGLEAIAIRLEAMDIRLEATAVRLEAIAIRLEAIAIGWRPSLVGWRPSLLGWKPSLLCNMELIWSRLGVECMQFKPCPPHRGTNIQDANCKCWKATSRQVSTTRMELAPKSQRVGLSTHSCKGL